MKASNTPIVVVLAIIAGIVLYAQFFLPTESKLDPKQQDSPEEQAFKKIQKDFPKEQQKLRQLFLMRRDSLNNSKNAILHSEMKVRIDDMIYHYLTDSLQLQIQNFIAEIRLHSVPSVGVSLEMTTIYPSVTAFSFKFSTNYFSKEDNEPLYNTLKSFEYPRLVRFSGRLKENKCIACDIRYSSSGQYSYLIDEFEITDVKAYEPRKD